MSISDLVLSGQSEIGKKINDNIDVFEENANFGYLRLFLACFWPGMTPISMSKALIEHI